MRRIGALALAAALAAGGAGAVERFSETYEVMFGGFRVAEIALSGESVKEGYSAEAKIRPTGLVGWFFDGRVDARAEGEGSLTAPRPASLSARSEFDGEARSFEMALDGARPVALAVEPSFDERDWDLAPDEAGAAVDPLSGALAALAPRPAAEACGRTVAVYDGRRRFDLALDPPRREGEALRCAGRFVRVAGFKPKSIQRRPVYEFDTRWEVEEGTALLDQLMVELDPGWVVVNRR